jgi:hypothetical protein
MDAASVKLWVETMAKDLGYDRAVREPPDAAPSR